MPMRSGFDSRLKAALLESAAVLVMLAAYVAILFFAGFCVRS